jgi:geranylgeranyl reductase family protein
VKTYLRRKYARFVSTLTPYDILIVGAGPAGCATALALRHSGLRCLLVDKATFPRDKVCGDAIPGRAIQELRKLDPAFAERFATSPRAMKTVRTAIHINGHAPFEFRWVNEAYTCRRVDFDAELLRLVRRHTPTEIREGVAITDLERRQDGVAVALEGADTPILTRLVIGADGAHSVVAKYLTGNRIDHTHYGAAVRTYYKGVTGVVPERAEIFVLPQFNPGYFWLFPLPGGAVNVGFGGHSVGLRRRQINLRRSVADFIAAYPGLAERFRHSEASTAPVGFGLPFGSRWIDVAGDRFLLTGDAAALIDPASGDGIGNALLSARLAAACAIRCAQAQDFSASATARYTHALRRTLGREFRRHTLGERVARRLPLLLDWGARAMQLPLVRNLVHHNW